MALNPVGGMLTGLARYQAHKFGVNEDKAAESLAGKIIIEDENLSSGYVQLPRYVLANKKLSSNAKICFAALLHYAWQKDSCYPGIDDFCEFLGLSKPTVISGLKDLEKSGYIEIKRWGQGKNNTYFLPKKTKKP